MFAVRIWGLPTARRNPLGDQGFRVMANAIQRCSKIEHLNISSLGITWQSMEAVGYMMRELSELDLSENMIGNRGVLIIAQMLPAGLFRLWMQ